VTVVVPSTCGSVQNKHAAAQSRCVVVVRNNPEALSNYAAAARNSHAAARSYKDEVKMLRPAGCIRHLG
jgi:hypothetical protein